MASIFELTALEKELDSKLFALDETDESDADAIKLVMSQLESVHAKIEDRLLWAAKMEQGTRAHAEAIKAVNKIRKKQEERAFRIADFWENYVKNGMNDNGIESIENDEIRVTYKLNRSTAKVVGLDGYDIKSLDSELWNEETIITPDLKKIKALLKTTEIDGLSLVISKSLRIS